MKIIAALIGIFCLANTAAAQQNIKNNPEILELLNNLPENNFPKPDSAKYGLNKNLNVVYDFNLNQMPVKKISGYSKMPVYSLKIDNDNMPIKLYKQNSDLMKTLQSLKNNPSKVR